MVAKTMAEEIPAMKENFAELFNEMFGEDKGLEGSVVKGTIVALTDDFVTIDVGLKSEGRIARREFGFNAEMKVGDQVDVFIDRYEDKDGNPTGKTLFVFKQKATATAKDGTKLTFKPALYDSRGNVIHPKDIGFGSVVRAAFEIVPYCNPSSGAGVQLRLRGVQIIELRTGELTAEALGFGIEEDGYVADETDETGTALAKAEAADGAPAPDESDF